MQQETRLVISEYTFDALIKTLTDLLGYVRKRGLLPLPMVP